ncbi:maleylacetate reductase [Epidermidibacterium keratini]
MKWCKISFVTLNFVHESMAQRVAFGSGRAAELLADEVRRLGGQRVMLIASDRDAALAGTLEAAIPVALRWDEVTQHVPRELADRARKGATEADIDVLVSVGGGSTVGLAKAIARTSGLPIVAVPTTYAGSEATWVWGETADGAKETGTDHAVLPRAVIYDSTLSTTLPLELSVASGLNALAHAVDGLWAPNADPINSRTALDGARALSKGLRGIVRDPSDLDARDECLYGTYLASVGFASAGSGMHHKICHVLGGTLNMPHAETHSVVLPYVLAYNTPGAPDQTTRLAEALSAGPDPAPADALAALNQLRADVDAPKALRDYGMSDDDIPAVLDRIVAAIPPSNPVPVTPERIDALLRAAIRGDAPTIEEDA